jgi:hypothetical protein
MKIVHVPMDIDPPIHYVKDDPMDIDLPVKAFSVKALPIPIFKKHFVPTQIIEHIYSNRMITDEPPNKVIIRSIV